MHGKGDLRARVLQQTVGDGGAGTLKGFLARLEQQLNRGVGINKLSLARFEHTSRTKQRRRVHIVTASMHAAVDRGKRLARLFRDGKSIHVTAQHDDRAGLIVRARTVAWAATAAPAPMRPTTQEPSTSVANGMSISVRRAWIYAEVCGRLLPSSGIWWRSCRHAASSSAKA